MKIYRISNISFLLLIFAYIFYVSNQAFSEEGAQDTKDVQKIDVVVDSYSFEPDVITVKANMPVELRLRSVTSIVPHNFKINYPDAGLVVDQDIGSGKDEVVTFTPTKTGTYEFYCGKKSIFANHKKKGMVGTLVVE